jgi:hypothetical protein
VIREIGSRPQSSVGELIENIAKNISLLAESADDDDPSGQQQITIQVKTKLLSGCKRIVNCT